MIERLDHIALFTGNARRTADFYCEWAGMEVIHDRQDEGSTHRVMWLRFKGDAAGLIIVIIENEDTGTPRRFDHFGFHVATRADVDEIAARARKAGVLVEGPIDAGPIIGYYCMISDPDGNKLEFSHEQQKA